MGRKITLISSYIIGVLIIIATVIVHYRYSDAVFAKYNAKSGETLVQQHFNTTMLTVGIVIALLALVTYSLKSKQK